MRTAVFLIAGFVALALAILAAWYGAPRAKHRATALAALIFMPVWFAVAAWNMAAGIEAGYGVLGEAPVFLAIFLPPALSALWIRTRFRHA